MLQKIQIFLEKYNMIEKGDHVIAGISGGADSVCLLLILKELQKRLPFVLTAVHVEHGIRGEESLRDEAFVEAFCRTEEIELRCFRVDAQRVAQERHMTLEEAARELRYGCFYEAAKQCGRGILPQVRGILSLDEALLEMKGFESAFVLYEGECPPLRSALPERGEKTALLIGSEGGFASQEIDAAKAAGICPVSLGKRILRCETAPIAALSAVMFSLGEMD